MLKNLSFKSEKEILNFEKFIILFLKLLKY